MALSELDKLLIEQIKVLRDQGFTRPQIAKELKITVSKLDTLVLQANLKPVSSKKISAERMKWLDKIAKQKNYKNFYAAPVGIERDRIAETATRRAEGRPIGYKGPRSEAAKASIKKHHHMRGMTGAELKAFVHKAQGKRWLKKAEHKINIMKQVENNVLNSKQIAKNLGLSHKKVLQEAEILFDNIYVEQMKVNKTLPRAELWFFACG